METSCTGRQTTYSNNILRIDLPETTVLLHCKSQFRCCGTYNVKHLYIRSSAMSVQIQFAMYRLANIQESFVPELFRLLPPDILAH